MVYYLQEQKTLSIKNKYHRRQYMQKINKDMIIGEVLQINSGLVPILLDAGMHCLGCPSSQMESLEDACMVHGMDVEVLVGNLNNYLTAQEA
jgi:hybrid cluster-associated redox disulfide protein